MKHLNDVKFSLIANHLLYVKNVSGYWDEQDVVPSANITPTLTLSGTGSNVLLKLESTLGAQEVEAFEGSICGMVCA